MLKVVFIVLVVVAGYAALASALRIAGLVDRRRRDRRAAIMQAAIAAEARTEGRAR